MLKSLIPNKPKVGTPQTYLLNVGKEVQIDYYNEYITVEFLENATISEITTMMSIFEYSLNGNSWGKQPDKCVKGDLLRFRMTKNSLEQAFNEMTQLAPDQEITFDQFVQAVLLEFNNLGPLHNLMVSDYGVPPFVNIFGNCNKSLFEDYQFEVTNVNGVFFAKLDTYNTRRFLGVAYDCTNLILPTTTTSVICYDGFPYFGIVPNLPNIDAKYCIQKASRNSHILWYKQVTEHTTVMSDYKGVTVYLDKTIDTDLLIFDKDYVTVKTIDEFEGVVPYEQFEEK